MARTLVLSAAHDPSPEPMIAASNGRLPRPGSAITREDKGQSIQAKVPTAGLEYQGRV